MKKRHDHRPRHHQPKQEDRKASDKWSNSLGDWWPKELSANKSKPQELKPKTPSPIPKPSPPPSSSVVPLKPNQSSEPVPEPGKKGLEIIVSKLPGPQKATANETNVSGDKANNGSRSQTRKNQYEDKMSQVLSIAQAKTPARAIPIILGIDFGTSTTKVAWREVGSDRAHLLCFGSRPELLENYLLPSVVAFDGKYFAAGADTEGFVRSNPKASRFSNFKMCLACVSSKRSECNPERCSLSHWRPLLAKTSYGSPLGIEAAIEAVSALHLGKVISVSKQFIAENLRSRGINPAIRWMVNMAAPVEHMEEQSVCNTFEKVLKIGWLMSQIFEEASGPRELYDLLDCYEAAKDQAAKRQMDCSIYPEIAAEVASMYLSRSARDGLYAFVDVGAGTVDTSIFRLYSSGQEPQLGFYGASVLKYGAAHLESIAARQLAERSATWFKSIKEKRATVGSAEFLLPEEAGIYLKNASEWIENRVEYELRQLLKDAYQKEHGSEHWKNLNLVIGGGGANIPVYTHASSKAFAGIAPDMTAEDLPTPQDLDMNGLPKEAFNRFAVAYGLSFNIVNLAEVALPDEISDHSQEKTLRPRKTIEMPTKDVC